MIKTNDSKKYFGLTAMIAIFFLFRTLVFLPAENLGISTTELGFSVSVRTVLVFILLILFSILSAVITIKLKEKVGEKAVFILVLLIADPVFFTLQNNCIRLIISCIGLLFTINAFGKKKVIPNELSICLFVLISAFLMPQSIVSYIALALLIYAHTNAQVFKKNLSKLTVFLPIIICIVIGVLINRYLSKIFENFSDIFDYLIFTQFKQKEQPFILALAALPLFLFGCYCFFIYTKEQSRLSKKLKKKMEPNFPYITLEICYFFSICGLFIYFSDAFLTINLFIPIMLIIMLLNNNAIAERVIDRLNTIIKNNYAIIIFIFVFYCIYSYTLICKFSNDSLILDYSTFTFQ